jgi:outer membrane protein assembly factor BamB
MECPEKSEAHIFFANSYKQFPLVHTERATSPECLLFAPGRERVQPGAFSRKYTNNMKTIFVSTSRLLPRLFWSAVLSSTAIWAIPGNAQPETIVYALQPASAAIGEYNANGATINADFIPAGPLLYLGGMLQSHDILYVASEVALSQFCIATYDAVTGTVINPRFFVYEKGNSQPGGGMALSGTSLFVPNYGDRSIAKIDIKSGAGNDRFITALRHGPPAYPTALALKGNLLFVANGDVNSNGKFYISEFNADTGELIDANFIQLLAGLEPALGLAIKGDVLYVSCFSESPKRVKGGVYTYNATTGELINSPFVSVHQPYGIAVSGNILFVASFHDFAIYEYDASTGAELSDYIYVGTQPENLAIRVVGQ